MHICICSNLSRHRVNSFLTIHRFQLPRWASKEPTFVDVSIKNPDESCGKMPLPVQLPHKVLEYLILDCKLSLEDALVQKYWNHLEEVGDPFALKTKEFRNLSILPVWPLGIHGDEAAIGLVNAPQNKITGITLNLVLFRPKATRLSRFLLWSIETEKLWSVTQTIYPVLERIAESLIQCAEEGVLGRRFLVTELRGDQAWFRLVFRHQAYWLSDSICFRCKATSQPNVLSYAFYDTESANCWGSTERSTDEFIRDELSLPYCCSKIESEFNFMVFCFSISPIAFLTQVLFGCPCKAHSSTSPTLTLAYCGIVHCIFSTWDWWVWQMAPCCFLVIPYILFFNIIKNQQYEINWVYVQTYM